MSWPHSIYFAELPQLGESMRLTVLSKLPVAVGENMAIKSMSSLGEGPHKSKPA